MLDKFKFSREFQIEILALMSQDWDFFVFCADAIKPEYFEDKILIWFFQCMVTYLEDYKAKPTLNVIENELLKSVSNKKIRKEDIGDYVKVFGNLKIPCTSAEYLRSELISFCKRQAMKNAITGPIAGLIKSDDDGSWDKIIQIVQDACNVGTDIQSLGEDYFGDYMERLRRMDDTDVTVVPTGILDLDTYIGGGVKSGQLLMFMGGTGKGKSIALVHVGKRSVVAGFKVLHYTLELSQDDVCKRYDSNWTRVPYQEVDTRHGEIGTKLENLGKRYGRSLLVKEFPTRSATVNNIKRHTARVINSGFTPDVIIIDYLDLIKPSTTYNDEYADLGAIAADLRGLAMELKVPIFSATQINRTGMSSEILDITHMSDSMKKAFIADIIIAICMTKEEKINNIARLVPIKNRNGPDHIEVPIRTAYDRMAFYVPGGISPDEIITPEQILGGNQ